MITEMSHKRLTAKGVPLIDYIGTSADVKPVVRELSDSDGIVKVTSRLPPEGCKLVMMTYIDAGIVLLGLVKDSIQLPVGSKLQISLGDKCFDATVGTFDYKASVTVDEFNITDNQGHLINTEFF